MAVGQWTGTSDLLPGYRHTKRMLEKLRDRVKSDGDLEILEDMIKDCNYAISILQSGRTPFYQRKNSSWEPDWINAYYSSNSSNSVDRSESEALTDQQRDMIKMAMFGLSRREKQCYMLHVVDGMSWRDIGLELHISKSTVQVNIERANIKIEENKIASLFLME